MNRLVRRARLGVLASAALVTGCLPQPVTSQGQSISNLYTIAMGMSAIVLAVVWIPTSWAILRYRRRRHVSDADDVLPPQTSGSRVAEVIWTAGPLVAIVILFSLTLLTLNTVNAAPSQGAVKLDVQAFRWGWRMTYPDEGVSVEGVRAPGPEAVLPVGRQIAITLTAQDVIHSFFVPQFLYKRDAIPGHPNTFTIDIQQPGSYAGECAELCGIYHSQMPFTITAVSDADYQAWLSDQRAAASP
jgi:cytochrome c oxidase subunit 2